VFVGSISELWPHLLSPASRASETDADWLEVAQVGSPTHASVASASTPVANRFFSGDAGSTSSGGGDSVSKCKRSFSALRDSEPANRSSGDGWASSSSSSSFPPLFACMQE